MLIRELLLWIAAALSGVSDVVVVDAVALILLALVVVEAWVLEV